MASEMMKKRDEVSKAKVRARTTTETGAKACMLAV